MRRLICVCACLSLAMAVWVAAQEPAVPEPLDSLDLVPGAEQRNEVRAEIHVKANGSLSGIEIRADGESGWAGLLDSGRLDGFVTNKAEVTVIAESDVPAKTVRELVDRLRAANPGLDVIISTTPAPVPQQELRLEDRPPLDLELPRGSRDPGSTDQGRSPRPANVSSGLDIHVPQHTTHWVLQPDTDPNVIAATLRTLFPQATIEVNVENKGLLVMASPGDMDLIERLIRRVSSNSPDQPASGAPAISDSSQDLPLIERHPPEAINRPQLRAQVSAQFDARQQRYRAEIAQFQAKLAALEARVNERERLKDQIIERRVEELVQPALRWEYSRHGTPDGGSSTGEVPALDHGQPYPDSGDPAAVLAIPKRPLLEGRVTAVASDRQMVELSIGTDDGVRRGMRLQVIREVRGQLLGVATLEVVIVNADRCVARVSALLAQADDQPQEVGVREGDRVQSMPPLQLTR